MGEQQSGRRSKNALLYTFIIRSRLLYVYYISKAALIYNCEIAVQALTLSNLDHWPRGPVDLRSYWPEGQYI